MFQLMIAFLLQYSGLITEVGDCCSLSFGEQKSKAKYKEIYQARKGKKQITLAMPRRAEACVRPSRRKFRPPTGHFPI